MATDVDSKPQSKTISNPFYFYLGLLCLALGFIGSLLPVMPTTIFLILVSSCFAKCSEKWRNKIYRIPKFGGAVEDWDNHGVISKKGKWASSLGMLIALTITATMTPLKVTIIVSLTLISVAAFIWTRPSEISEDVISYQNAA